MLDFGFSWKQVRCLERNLEDNRAYLDECFSHGLNLHLDECKELGQRVGRNVGQYIHRT